MCPHCHKDAPILYKGVVPYCTACGAVRAPFTGSSVNLAGKPSKVGGTMASVAGVMLLIVGLSVALMVGLIPAALGYGMLGLALGVPVGLLSLSLGLIFLLGGRNLSKSGADAANRTREQGIFALASHRGGFLRATDVAQALGISVGEANAQLEALAKEKSESVSLELDEDGGIFYRFMNEPGASAASAWGRRVRVAQEAGPLAGPRVVAPVEAQQEQRQEELEELESPVPPLQEQGRRRAIPG